MEDWPALLLGIMRMLKGVGFFWEDPDMPSAKRRIEVKVSVNNEPGQLTGVLDLVSKSGVNLLAFCGYATGPESGEVLMVPDHDGKARRALEEAGHEVEINTVLAVPATPGRGSGARIASKLSSYGINVEHAYASAAPDGRSTAVFRVKDGDLEEALKALS